MSVVKVEKRRKDAMRFINSNKNHIISKINEGCSRYDLCTYIFSFIGVKSKTVKMLLEDSLIQRIKELEKGE